MKKITLLIFLLFPCFSFALTPEKQADDALQFYRNKDYGKAIGQWQLLKSVGFGGAYADYNIGNAYFRMGNLGYAKAYWLKAERQKPRDEKVFHNLLYLKKLHHGTLGKEEENSINRWLSQNYFRFRMNYEESLKLNLVLGLIVSLPLVVYLFKRKTWAKKASFATFPFYLLSLGVLVYLSIQQVYMQTGVSLQGTKIYEEPIESSQVLGELQEGEEVRILDLEGEVLFIKNSLGESGWVLRSDVLKI